MGPRGIRVRVRVRVRAWGARRDHGGWRGSGRFGVELAAHFGGVREAVNHLLHLASEG